MAIIPSLLRWARRSGPHLRAAASVGGALLASACLFELPDLVEVDGGGGGGGQAAGGSAPVGGGSGGQGGFVTGGGSGGQDSCGGSSKLCPGLGCKSKADPAFGCGAEDCQPCQGGSNASTSCSPAFECRLVCPTGFVDCDGEPSNGCERNFGNVAAKTQPLLAPLISGIDVDGDPADWGSIPAYALDTACIECSGKDDGSNHDVVAPGSVPPHSDLQANFRVAWDGTFLYVFAEAFDDEVVRAVAGTENPASAEDGFELLLDGLNNRAPRDFSNDDHLVFLSVSEAVRGRNNEPQMGQVRLAVTTDQFCYRVEAGISWTYLVGNQTPGRLPPAVNTVYGFDFAVNDWDTVAGFEEPQRESQVFLSSPGNEYWFHLNGLSELKLVDVDAGTQ